MNETKALFDWFDWGTLGDLSELKRLPEQLKSFNERP